MTPGNIIALCGVVITLIFAFAKFIAALSEFSSAVKQLTKQIAEMKDASQKEHDELWRANEDHEKRIRTIEINHGGNNT